MTPSVQMLDSDTKRMVEDALDRFVDEAYEPSARHARVRQGDVDDRLHWPALAGLGVLGLPAGEALGGIGGSTLDVSDVVRALARGLLLEPFIEGAVVAGALLRRGPEAAAATAGLVSGETLTILVGGRRGDHLRATRGAGRLRVSGTARVVPAAASADSWLVACVDASGAPMVLRAAARDLDARLQRYRLMDGRPACDVEFAGSLVPDSAVWLEGAAAQAALDEAAAQAVCAYCSEAAGIMQCLVRMTGEYLRTREQFGVPIGSFQALQHRLADMHMAMLEARAMAREMARCIDQCDLQRTAWLRYAAPTVLARRAERVGHEAIQMHGGMGVTHELIVGHYNARLVVLNKLLAGWMCDPPAGTAPTH